MQYTKKKLNKATFSGVTHWKFQRISAIFLIPGILWFVFSVIIYVSKGYAEAIEWVINPINATFLIILFAIIFYHSGMGLHVVLEDYISDITLRKRAITSCNFLLLCLACISILSILKIILL